MKKTPAAGIGFFEKYLTLWVIGCMVLGVAIGIWSVSGWAYEYYRGEYAH